MNDQIFFTDSKDNRNDSLRKLIEQLEEDGAFELPEELTGYNKYRLERVNDFNGHKATEEDLKNVSVPISSLSMIEVPGFDIKPFIPSKYWIQACIMQCFEIDLESLGTGKYSFSLNAFGIYRIPMHGFDFGASMGEVVDFAGSKANWNITEEIIENIPAVTVQLEFMYMAEKYFPIEGKMCRCVYVEPAANSYHLNLLWFGKETTVKSVYDHKNKKWID